MALQRYVLLPEAGAIAPEGLQASALAELPRVRSTEAPTVAPVEAAEGRDVRFVDSVGEAGPRLVEVEAETAETINRSEVPLRALPVVEYPLPHEPLGVLEEVVPAAAGATVSVACTDAVTGSGVAGARVVAFTDVAKGEGGEGHTDASGTASLTLPAAAIERLIVVAPQGYWGTHRSGLAADGPIAIPLTPVDLGFVDCVRHYYGSSKFDVSRGVQVGILDTGIGPHDHLQVASGINTVTGEPREEFQDPTGHGTHVAGLVGSKGAPPAGLRGVAPGVALRAYRVFPPDGGATNYAILKAMIFAAGDGCDIVNLSLGSKPSGPGDPGDPIVEEAVADARNSGMLVIVANGNDGRQPVNFPAAYPLATAVSAMGREGAVPPGALEETRVLRPPAGTDPADFVASFSNVGPQTAATGPGVGVLSTLPGNGFGPMSGTSMAAPVVAGAVASLLSQNPDVFAMARDTARSEAIASLLRDNCTPLGFGPEFEGAGLPDPAIV